MEIIILIKGFYIAFINIYNDILAPFLKFKQNSIEGRILNWTKYFPHVMFFNFADFHAISKSSSMIFFLDVICN
jgi:hypothetical protein